MIIPWLVTLSAVATIVLLTAPLAQRLGLVASPGAHRRHTGSVPLCGGLAISIGLGTALFIYGVYPGNGFLIGWLLLLTIGVIDDRFSLPYWIRFLVQIVAMLLVIWMDNVVLIDLGHVFSSDVVSLGGFSTALTVFAGVGVINAINMVDGMDGLAGSLVLVCVVGLLETLGGTGSTGREFALLLSAAIVGFLLFNVRWRGGARVFMGDAGSTSIGFFVTWLLISMTQGEPRPVVPVIALWLLAIPLFDAVGVLMRRPIRGSSPFNADWLHTHHLLLRAGLSVNQALLAITVTAAVIAATGLFLMRVGLAEHHLFYLFLGLFGIYLLIMEWGERALRYRAERQSMRIEQP